MSKMQTSKWLVLALGVFTVQLALADSDSAKKTTGEVSAQSRQKMAEMHDKMATCLRSDKQLTDCHDEMWMACKENGHSEICPMMGKGMKHRKAKAMKRESEDKE